MFIILIGFFYWITKDLNERPKRFLYTSLLIHICVLILSQFWLLNYTDHPFHPSDPTQYFLSIKDLYFHEIFNIAEFIESSNTIYFVINLIFYTAYGSPFVYAFDLLLCNLIFFFIAYSYFLKTSNKITTVDYLIFFNPYFVFTYVRNVRDLLICSFALIAIVLLNKKRRYFIKSLVIYILYLLRPFMVIPVLVSYLIKKNRYASALVNSRVALILGLGIGVFLIVNTKFVFNQMISALSYHHMEAISKEDIESSLQGNFTFNFILIYVKAFFVFLFTPHPISSIDKLNIGGIYTSLDLLYIKIGAIFNYCFVIHKYIVFKDKKFLSNPFGITTIFLLFIYSIFHLGITDIRIKFTFFFFLLLGIRYADIKFSRKELVISVLFVVIVFFILL